MADRLTPAARSELMSRIRGDDLGPERALRNALRLRGVRFRRNVPGLPGRPDVVVPSARLAVFVHGCFWHLCPRHARMPGGERAGWWARKLWANARRDERARRALRRMGWSTMVVWEHETRRDPDAAAARVARRAARCNMAV